MSGNYVVFPANLAAPLSVAFAMLAGAEMLGLLCHQSERETVSEFFELLKSPWEYWSAGRSYGAIISTLDMPPAVDTRLVVLFSSMPMEYDTLTGTSLAPATCGNCIEHNGSRLPIYRGLARLHGPGWPLLYDQSGTETIAMAFSESRMSVLRVGYNLFHEVAYLLSTGQPGENAMIPALEAHIALLRHWIAQAGLPLVEIPPAPHGHPFIACLTHDVDFAGIRQHGLDHTFWGFLHRALLGSVRNVATSRGSWAQLRQNWAAVATLPLVYAGRRPDPWDQFEHYAEIEGGQPSTFFLIPFKDTPGQHVPGRLAARRATRYDVDDIRPQVQRLAQRGCEIGVHGLDAWHSAEKGRQELGRIRAATGQDGQVGVRIHWLCCDDGTPAVLEQAGFDYDSTCGYNQAIGFKAGTTQVFRPPGATRLLELPLHIQDTALFYPGRMGLAEADAWARCQAILDAAGRYGGVVTVLWHQRSLAPERLWGDFYVRLLHELRRRGAWLATAGQAVSWFRQRRQVTFESCQLAGNMVHVHLTPGSCQPEAGLFLRVHQPATTSSAGAKHGQPHRDLPWNGDRDMWIGLN